MNEITVSILGCGWLGLPLAKTLMSDGFKVRGSTTSTEKLSVLQQAGIDPFLIRLNPVLNESVEASFFRSEIMVINIPPGRRREDVQTYYATQIGEVLARKPSKKIIFVSSSSVYPDCNREVRESDSPAPETNEQSLKASGRALLTAENLIRTYSNQATIIRFCGLMGPDRHPGRFLAGKQLESNGQSPINFIHLDDCIAIIMQIIRQEIWGEVFNACAEVHPDKQTFYTLAAEKLSLPPPQFSETNRLAYKVVNSDKLKQHLGYRFIHPDPSKAL